MEIFQRLTINANNDPLYWKVYSMITQSQRL